MLTIRRRVGESVRVGKIKFEHVVSKDVHMLEITIPGQEAILLRVRHEERMQMVLDIRAPKHIDIRRGEIDHE